MGIGREFFPQVDAGQITLYLRTPSGTNLEAAEQRIIDVERFLKDHIPANERKMIISELGLVPDWSAAYTANSGTQDCTIKVQLSDERTKSAQEYAIVLRRCLRAGPQVQRPAGQLRHRRHGVRGLELRGLVADRRADRRGQPCQQALALAQQIRDEVAGIRGAADVHIQQRLDARSESSSWIARRPPTPDSI